MTVDELDTRFTHHEPKRGQAERYLEIRQAGKYLAMVIDDQVPESREKSLALTKVEEAVMWANAAIARRE